MAKPKLRYDKQQVPEGGWSVQLGVTTIAGSKEPVGTAFHSKVRAAVGAAPSMHSTDSCSSFDNSVDDSDAEAAATGGRSSSDSLSGCAIITNGCQPLMPVFPGLYFAFRSFLCLRCKVIVHSGKEKELN